jgi:hypothetical protein
MAFFFKENGTDFSTFKQIRSHSQVVVFFALVSAAMK